MPSFSVSRHVRSARRLYKPLSGEEPAHRTLLNQLRSGSMSGTSEVLVTEARGMFLGAYPEIYDSVIRRADVMREVGWNSLHEYGLLYIYRPNSQEPYGYLRYERIVPKTQATTHSINIGSTSVSASSPGATLPSAAGNTLTLSRTASDPSFPYPLARDVLYYHNDKPSNKAKTIATIEDLNWRLTEVISACQTVTRQMSSYNLANAQCYVYLVLYLLLEIPLSDEHPNDPSDSAETANAASSAPSSDGQDPRLSPSAPPPKPLLSGIAKVDTGAAPSTPSPSITRYPPTRATLNTWADLVRANERKTRSRNALGRRKSGAPMIMTTLKEAEEKGKLMKAAFRRKYEELEALRRDRVSDLEWVKAERHRTDQEAERAAKEAERAAKEAERAAKEAERAAEEAERAAKEAKLPKDVENRAAKEADLAAKEADLAAKEADRAAQEADRAAEFRKQAQRRWDTLMA